MALQFVTRLRLPPLIWLLASLLVTTAIYFPGVYGTFLFDDFPNIVDNTGVHAHDWSLSSLTTAALSSPSSEFKRPLASLTFAVNYLVGGIDPLGMKMTNIIIHLLNGIAAFLLMRLLFAGPARLPSRPDAYRGVVVSALWLILPINLTAVLYVVQRMESLANLCVLLGLVAYVSGRRSMIAGKRGFMLAVSGLLGGTAIGLLAKETAVLTPLYAGLIEWIVLRGRGSSDAGNPDRSSRRVIALFILVLAIPFLAGSLIVGPSLFAQSTWAPRNFTMPERLLSECRVVVDYIEWTLLPMPSDLSFYHDNFVVSTGWLKPWTTLASFIGLIGLAAIALLLRKRRPLVSLGIAFFFACHSLTATIIPLELIYEHRNYFSSLGLMLALVAFLRGQDDHSLIRRPSRRGANAVLILFGIYSASMTAYSASRWGGPISLAQELAVRAPTSPRAQYELGRTYIIASKYDPSSPLIAPAYRVLEKTAALPAASTLPEQALIFLAAKLHQPIQDRWWDSMEAKLQRGPVAIEDESSVISLSSCYIQKACDISRSRVLSLFLAALDHPSPRARVFGAYADFAWNGLDDKSLGLAMAKKASEVEPSEPTYHLTAARFALALGDANEAARQLSSLESLNLGGRLNTDIASLRPRVNAELSRPSTSRESPRGTP